MVLGWLGAITRSPPAFQPWQGDTRSPLDFHFARRLNQLNPLED
ncbi:MAG: hypothetical protein VKJ64_08870 [Leptolyngbyaceae bacterium]|nr:hypothetical protein [Leptolyngbyaceae bacterium]